MSYAPTVFAPHPAPLHPAHVLWRLLPQVGRRRALAYVTACLAPRPDRLAEWSIGALASADEVPKGLAVGGELSRASGLGEGARLMLGGVAQLGLPAWPVDLGTPDGLCAAEVPQA